MQRPTIVAISANLHTSRHRLATTNYRLFIEHRPHTRPHAFCRVDVVPLAQTRSRTRSQLVDSKWRLCRLHDHRAAGTDEQRLRVLGIVDESTRRVSIVGVSCGGDDRVVAAMCGGGGGTRGGAADRVCSRPLASATSQRATTRWQARAFDDDAVSRRSDMRQVDDDCCSGDDADVMMRSSETGSTQISTSHGAAASHSSTSDAKPPRAPSRLPPPSSSSAVASTLATVAKRSIGVQRSAQTTPRQPRSALETPRPPASIASLDYDYYDIQPNTDELDIAHIIASETSGWLDDNDDAASSSSPPLVSTFGR